MNGTSRTVDRRGATPPKFVLTQLYTRTTLTSEYKNDIDVRRDCATAPFHEQKAAPVERAVHADGAGSLRRRRESRIFAVVRRGRSAPRGRGSCHSRGLRS